MEPPGCRATGGNARVTSVHVWSSGTEEAPTEEARSRSLEVRTNMCIPDGTSPLSGSKAVRLDLVSLLLEAGASPHATLPETGHTAAHLAAQYVLQQERASVAALSTDLM